MKGQLITLEGQDASGKSEFLKLIPQELSKYNIDCLVIPEFSSNVIGEFIKKILHENKFIKICSTGKSSITQTMYLLADLYSQDEMEIQPALAKGKVVLKERHLDSIMACQIPKILEEYLDRDLNELLIWLKSGVSKLTKPDLTCFLQVNDVTLRQRINGRNETVTEEDFKVFHERQKVYDLLAEENQGRWLNVNNDRTPESALHQIVNKIIKLIK